MTNKAEQQGVSPRKAEHWKRQQRASPFCMLLSYLPMVLILLSEICIYTVTVFVVLLPKLSPDKERPPALASLTSMNRELALVYTVALHVVILLQMISFIRTMITPPGGVPNWLEINWHPKGEEEDGLDNEEEQSKWNVLEGETFQRKRNGGIRICTKCDVQKPDRSHHCHECGKCILQQDHHSFIFNSCIGFYNYKYFLLTTFYSLLTTVLVGAITVPDFFRLIYDSQIGTVAQLAQLVSQMAQNMVQWLQESSLAAQEAPGSELVAASIIVVFIANMVFMMILLWSLVFHLFLIYHGYSQADYWRAKGKYGKLPRTHHFDYRPSKNFALVLGSYPLLWLVPTCYGVQGNGIFHPQSEFAF